MSKSAIVIKCMQEQYHYTIGQIYALYPELLNLVIVEDLAKQKRNARVRRYKLIRK